MTETSTDLFSPLDLGRYRLANRVTMAALTRQRAGTSGVPTDLHAEYYFQRASAGLVVTEGTFPSVTTRAFPGQAGIETDEQAAGWRRVAERVHEGGGVLFMQIMHGGRVSHPNLLEGQQPEAPSALEWGGQVHTFDGKQDAPVPRALEAEEMPRIVEQFRAAARRAVDAGLDGVEIHGANGYLLHEFLSPVSNTRDDDYGGSPRNRYRLVEEVVRAVAADIGADRTALRLSPEHNIQGVIEEDRADTLATFGGLLDALSDLNLAYVSLLHKDAASDDADSLPAELARRARANGATRVIANTGFGHVTDLDEANALMALPHVDAVAVGRQLIANPDLVLRWREGLELNTPDAATFYAPGAEGYTDYPFAGAPDA
ncbi:alkene reductase [Corynebacterium incognita]|uniref:Alkene reductase n=1 Tax=Corynebacterium incognita TaxID=2754725 RepID=A0A7G7CQR7_9CORY|nr:alkene reductase [Corynebacterium incognita]QNE89933.1 alkene reductase [Corynebacterium incognita]